MRLGSLARSRPWSVRGAVAVAPADGSMRAVLATVVPLDLPRWDKHEREYANAGWTGQCNGVTTDGSTWLVTSNRNPPTGAAAGGGGLLLHPGRHPTMWPGVFEVDDEGAVQRHHHVDRAVAGHVGDLDLAGDRVYVALEQPNQVLVLDRHLQPLSRFPVDTPDGHFAWCAIHPFNGHLYTSAWDDASTLYALDARDGQRLPDADVPLDHVLHRVQGGTFSPQGQVFLASDDRDGGDRQVQPGIHAFSASTGTSLGHLPVDVAHGAVPREEIEGIGYGRRRLGGTDRLVHLVLLDQDLISGDDVHLKSWGPSA